MFTSDFERKIKKVEPVMRVDYDNAVDYQHGSKITGLFFGDLHVCSIPVPELPIKNVYTENGKLDAQGLWEVLRVITSKGCVRQSVLERKFGMSLGSVKVDIKAMDNFQEHKSDFLKKGNPK